ncbi:MAG TPA: CehA/McbA family metallohydrolase [Woeseiaceae bacterium]|nr:CehA/McbA family metallohydrolase [Woeseiaceae bacterium]
MVAGMPIKFSRIFLLLPLLVVSTADAQRAPVLQQIKVPHDYYFREMYLPQVTTGPASPTWSPDGETLVYSMQGSLWGQATDSTTAVQLTAGPGYDYQPDWSPDGRYIVFVRYNNDAMELQLLDPESGEVVPLTSGGAVNTEPRWSPDGSRLAFVSTSDGGRFRLFVGSVDGKTLNATPLLEDRESDVERYYYSSFDHQLSPSWSPDGAALMYVSNPEVVYGTGGIWKHPLDSDAGPTLVRGEETTWRARPDWSPDGKRVVYASYLGRQWHQLWAAGVEGNAEPFPLTYGEFDISSPRWSPDGQRIAYIANESGNTELRVQEVLGGKVKTLAIEERQYRQPMGEVRIAIVDANGRRMPGRVAVVAADGRSYAPHAAWMHADDSFDRRLADFETRYFHSGGQDTLTLPPGPARITVWRGLESAIRNRLVNVRAGETISLDIESESLDLPEEWREWQSGDVHVHMNYGGTYRNTPDRLVRQAAAEDLDLVFNLIVNKEQRIPDIAHFSPEPDAASTGNVLLLHAQEYHTSYWGHMGLLGLDEHLLIPDYSSYPGTAAASLFPDNATVADLAHAQNAAVGYVHPFLSPPPNPATDASLTNAFPVDVALGKVDYYEVVGFADHRASAEVWYRLLNLGFRVAAAGGTDAMANYASLRGPVGVNRVYVKTDTTSGDPAARLASWLDGLKAGHTIATNGPLLGLNVQDEGPGGEIVLGDGTHELEYSGFLRSIVPIDHLELVFNGEVLETIDPGADRKSANLGGRVRIDRSGWLLLRAWNEGSHPMIFDLYPYATTTPVYINVGDIAPGSREDADYFIAWIERIRESASEHPDYNSPEERETVLRNLDDAQRIFEQRRD